MRVGKDRPVTQEVLRFYQPDNLLPVPGSVFRHTGFTRGKTHYTPWPAFSFYNGLTFPEIGNLMVLIEQFLVGMAYFL
jgi:hypothetical protein